MISTFWVKYVDYTSLKKMTKIYMHRNIDFPFYANVTKMFNVLIKHYPCYIAIAIQSLTDKT